MVLAMRALIIIALALTPVALGQDGAWRLESTDDRGRPTGGVVRIEAGRYERRTREELGDPVVIERGVARVENGVLVTEAEATPGLAGALSGGASAGWRGRYALSADVADGERALGGQVIAERLVRVADEVAGNDVRLLVDGEAFQVVRQELRAATTSVDLQVFQWMDDATGRSVSDILAERARAGLDVRCLVDARSKTITRLVHGKDARDFTDGLDETLRAAGVEVLIQHPTREKLRGSLENLRRALSRAFGGSRAPVESRGWKAHDHRKLTVIDGRVAFTGGQNIAEDYEHRWHDVQARLEGPAVGALAALFQDRWQAAGGRSSMGAGGAPATSAGAWAGDVPVEVVGSIPGLPDEIWARMKRALREARREVLIEMAFMCDDEAVNALQEAARRGVRVVVVMPDDAEQVDRVTREAFRWVQNDVLRSGVELHQLRGRMVHAKVAVFDDRLATLGSHNLTGSELAEINLFVPDARFVRVMRQRLWDVDLPRCARVQVERMGWDDRIKSFGARALRALL
jgi:cardiolipin synthase A/B